MAASFTIESVADSIPAGGPVSLALDRAGNPRIAFSQQGSGQIVVATRNGGAWTTENVPGAFAPASGGLRLAIDSAGNPQIAYLDLSSGGLAHAAKRAGKWSSAQIPTRLTWIIGPAASGASISRSIRDGSTPRAAMSDFSPMSIWLRAGSALRIPPASGPRR
ncbi:MAG TPA: hypothetical protein VMB83_11755 [Roseiarcus sp.]|nr:hypothetical protein [Roseiarcus sp.]